ncbi:PI-PLC X domain-containing protein 1-like isoform 2-T2 [Pholidichthys leucotaenia]
MSYDLDTNSSIVEPNSLKILNWICCARKLMKIWAKTQEDTITEQLDAGVRYFDLRIARRRSDPNPTRLYFYHGLRTHTDVETILRSIHDWAQKHPKEILILAFSNFLGFDQKLHNHLINFIKTLFGGRLLSRVGTPTLKNCWDRGKSVIVSYDYNQAIKHPELWRKIPYYYGDSMNPADIEAKLDQAVKKERPLKRFFVCGLNLTLPSDARILKYVLRLCDNFPNVVRRSLPKLLRWMQSESGMNIVAADLATRADFVSTVVALNATLLKPK